MHINRIICFILVILCLLLNCSNIEISGGTSEVGNPTGISGDETDTLGTIIIDELQ